MVKKNIQNSRIIAVTPPHLLEPQIAVAACRAGGLGVLDLGLNSDTAAVREAVARLGAAAGANSWGVRIDCLGSVKRLEEIAPALDRKPAAIIFAGLGSQTGISTLLKKHSDLADNFILEVSSLETAKKAEKAGFDGVIVKGCEAGGHVGNLSSFVLLQKLHGQLNIPYWLQGGMGLNTGAAACMSGAAGIVLAEQLWLTWEGPYGEKSRKKFWAKLDGSETTLLEGGITNFRLFSRSGRSSLKLLTEAMARGDEWQPLLRKLLRDNDPEDRLIPLGQDIALAAAYGEDYGTTGRVINAYFEAIDQRPGLVKEYKPLSGDTSLAEAHGTRYPIVQGPMAQVSDIVPFAQEVAGAGGLPFLALALMDGNSVRSLLAETAGKLAGKPWGVGLLGFIPHAMRQEQFGAVKEFKPPYALIAGGRPGQAAELEAAGIRTYLHVPSSSLLDMFIKQGARSFVFEGSEAGGHIGPRTSFILWELAIQKLLSMDIEDPGSFHVLFAGGIHDSLSTAIIARLAAPLAERGFRIGLQMGSAYLFTEEAVATGAIQPEFQAQALDCRQTAVLRSAHGHATRCARTPYCDFFARTKNEMVLAGRSEEEILENLERLNSGRLRIAAKGVARNPNAETGAAQDRYVVVSPAKRVREGLFMLGDIGSLRNRTISIAELHAGIAAGCSGLTVPDRRQAPVNRPHKRQSRRAGSRDIAIVGLSCFFPGAHDVRRYWENIVNRADLIREVSDRRWHVIDFYDPDRLAADKIYSKWGGFLDDIQFDPIRYGIPPASLRSVEPMQLLALEAARRAMEDAGLDRLKFPRERTAVIFGSGGMQDTAINYIFRTMLTQYLPGAATLEDGQSAGLLEELHGKLPVWTEDSFPGVLANVTAGRVANRLNLQGSNFTVDAACASSLTALDVGISRLRAGDADLALIGAADGTNNAVSYMAFSKTHALSPQGRCRPFDDSADGIAISEGVAAIILKRLDDAERDGDRIYALIKGVGSSSDGRNRSLTAPHPEGQVLAVQRAYQDAGVDPSTVGLVEAHGTGTAAGDKAEIESLCLAFGSGKAPNQTCGVGSVKSMIGHTKVAAGMAGVIKAVMAMHHRVLPPTIGVENPNTHVDFSRTPFFINSEPRPWFRNGSGLPRRCGISAFGFGGSNFHAVLEEYTGAYRSRDAFDFMPRSHEIFSWSRTDQSELRTALASFVSKIANGAQPDLRQLAAALYSDESTSRTETGAKKIHRLAIVAGSVDELRKKLSKAQDRLNGPKTDFRTLAGVYYSSREYGPDSIGFLFPGQGSQKANMLRDLVMGNVCLHPVFERADKLLEDRLSQDLSRYIYPLPVFSDEERGRQELMLRDTRVAQPALGVVDLAAFDLLGTYNLKPQAVAGHSYGEYVALCSAGVISRDDLILLSEIRGRLVAEASESNPGTMAAVQADGSRVPEMIERFKLSVVPANYNGPDQTVVAGGIEAVNEAVETFNRENVLARKIPVTAAFHTRFMQDAADRLVEELGKITFKKGNSTVYSNTLADRYPKTAAAMRKLLGQHLVRPVRFAEQIEKMYNDGIRVFVEAGPGRVLNTLVQRILEGREHVTLNVDMAGRTGWEQLAHLLGQAFTLGLPVELDRWFKDRVTETVSVDAILEQAGKDADPPRHIWRINGGGVEPWHEQPVDDLKLRMQPVKTNTFNAAKMTKNITPQNIHPLQTGPTPGDSLQAQIQNNMTQFMELQRQQLEITRQFLELQEKLLDSASGTNVPAARGASAVMAPPKMSPPPRMPGLNITPSVAAANPAPNPLPNPGQATPAPTSAPAPAISEAGPEQFHADLLRAVSERTGYPEEMLDLDANLEADLGIDSIKRVEIFNTLKEHHDLLEGRDEETLLEELAGLKTLRRIIDWHKGNMSKAEVAMLADSKKKKLTPEPAPAGNKARSGPDTGVERFVVTPLPAPLVQQPDELTNFPEEHLILLVGEAPAISAGLQAALGGSSYRVRQIVPGRRTRVLDSDRLEVDLTSIKSVQEMYDLLSRENDTVGAVFNLMGLASVLSGNGSESLDDAVSLFLLLKVLEKDLHDSSGRGGGWLINFTNLGGRFGLDGRGQTAYRAAGTIGIVKSAAREWPWLRAKTIDLDPAMDPHMLVAQILSELAAEDPQVEVGFNAEGRWRLETAKEEPVSVESWEIDPEGVVLATGGARGITAEICRALASRYRPRLILVGSSGKPVPEPAETRDLAGTQELRRYLIGVMKAADPEVKPAEIEKRLNRILRDREMSANIRAMEEAGARVEYHALDVRDDAAFGKLIEEIYARWGRIDGVIHGAGRVDDKLIRHKSPESFEAVYQTKVRPAEVMAAKLRPDLLKFLVFFSSVSGRYGNVGQCDYSAANEVLNKLADRLNREWPGTRVVAINWGPWASGMVNDELCRMYDEKGIKLIPVDTGVAYCLDELQPAPNGPAEVVISASVRQISQWGLGKA